MLNQLLKFELKYHFRQLTFIASVLIFIVLGWIMSKGNFGSEELHKNAPYVINYIICLLSLFVIFVSMVVGANVLLRDQASGMESLLFATPLKKIGWFAVRLVGFILAVFLIFTMAVPGMMVCFAGVDPARLGTASMLAYLQPLLAFGLPNVIFCCSIVFATALLSRSAKMVYAAGVLLFILYLTGSILGNSPMLAGSAMKTNDGSLLPYLLDPFGINAFFLETRNWTVIDRNQRLFPVSGVFALNRILWIGVSILLLLLSYRRFRFSIAEVRAKKPKQLRHEEVAVVAYHPVTVQANSSQYLRQAFGAQCRLELASVFRHLGFLFMMVLWVFMYLIDLKEGALEGPYGMKFHAITGYIVENLISVRPGLLLLLFYGAEIIYRERAVKVEGLVFSTPVPSLLLWGAKTATLLMLVLLLTSVNILMGICVQLVLGEPIEWSLYAILYYYSALPLFFFTILIVFVQTLTGNKFAGLLVSGVVIGIIVFARNLGIDNQLTGYALLPEMKYSPMNGWGHYTHVINWYLLLGSFPAIILALLTAAIWRGTGSVPFRKRLQTVPKILGRKGLVVIVLALAGWIATGSYIQMRTNRGGIAADRKAYNNWKILYEKKYGAERKMQQPYVIAVKTKVDLYPELGTYAVDGEYVIRNESASTISLLWLGISPEVTSASIKVPGASPVQPDEQFRQYRFKLASPLKPGDTCRVLFTMQVDRSGFLPFNTEHAVVNNGSYVELEKYLPYFGYNNRLEVFAYDVRAKAGLGPTQNETPADSNYHFVDYESILSTEAGQTAITVGSLVKQWQEGQRSYFHYKTERSIPFMFAFSSAKYSMMLSKENGIAYAVYYHAGMEENLPVLMQALKDAGNYGSMNFAPYPHNVLSLVELPHYPGAATAYPGVVFSKDKFNFASDFRDSTKANQVYMITAHETAHQWWADIMLPYLGPGCQMLTESLAKYTEIVALEKRYGRMQVRNYLDTDQELYFKMRNEGNEKELPLSTSDQGVVYYQKGGLTLFAIKEAIGEEQMNKVLATMISKYTPPGRAAIPQDFIRELKSVADSSKHAFIDDLLTRVIVYDAALKLVSCNKLPNGQYELKLDATLLKKDYTSGKPESALVNDDVSIAVFDQPESAWNNQTKPVHTQRFHFSASQNQVKIVLDKNPAAVAIDPMNCMIDENRDNNVLVLQ
ncbi:hypothetical protein HHL16_10305 [Pseudoflavitalea sp. G-6-1-2]|uniref:M1 family aminopeptidase n=1 Tax=Pseudoflavitalea sp. G-6-1-2 TaxID=2728841 RepID=UPI00146DD71B|nr:M1 family aminopeptidase [Pseudoflavitalea sp. G-6-1-2]NML21266.1 hypothetical protein [Pseudoflavitalea sp. G-6-1-2]